MSLSPLFVCPSVCPCDTSRVQVMSPHLPSLCVTHFSNVFQFVLVCVTNVFSQTMLSSDSAIGTRSQSDDLTIGGPSNSAAGCKRDLTTEERFRLIDSRDPSSDAISSDDLVSAFCNSIHDNEDEDDLQAAIIASIQVYASGDNTRNNGAPAPTTTGTVDPSSFPAAPPISPTVARASTTKAAPEETTLVTTAAPKQRKKSRSRSVDDVPSEKMSRSRSIDDVPSEKKSCSRSIDNVPSEKMSRSHTEDDDGSVDCNVPLDCFDDGEEVSLDYHNVNNGGAEDADIQAAIFASIQERSNVEP